MLYLSQERLEKNAIEPHETVLLLRTDLYAEPDRALDHAVNDLKTRYKSRKP
jgi:hypothetical protein